jgi:NADH:ubiquinone oxidoreductase subunit 6 (subunit J)
MTTVQFVFYFFAGLTVVSALFVLFTKNVLHAVLSLLSVFLGVSALYVFAGADFLAVTQLVIYVGGVLVLMLFGVMLTNRETGAVYPVSKNKYFVSGIISGVLILGMLIYLIIKNKEAFLAKGNQENIYLIKGHSTVHFLGMSLISEYLLAFEAVGILLLMALIGAAFVAGRKTS